MPKAERVLTRTDYEMAVEIYSKKRSVQTVAETLNIPKSRANRLIQNGIPSLNLPPIKDAVDKKIETSNKMYNELGSEQDRNFYLVAYMDLRKKIVEHIKNPATTPEVNPKQIETLDKLFTLRERIREEEKEVATFLMLPFDDMTSADIRDLALGKRRPKK